MRIYNIYRGNIGNQRFIIIFFSYLQRIQTALFSHGGYYSSYFHAIHVLYEQYMFLKKQLLCIHVDEYTRKIYVA